MPFEVPFQEALRLARSRKGFCAPNPAVGAVVVDENGQIIGRGRHFAPGHPHAEVEAVAGLAPNQLENATLFVTLEPCCHHGRTPPCTELILEKGIKRIRFAYLDPNPLVSGKGQAQLKAAGVDCEPTPQPDITAFYESYAHWTRTRRPFITAKLALSLDGKIAGPGGVPHLISGPEVARLTHQGRLEADAILTTVRTVLADDPRLNVRVGDETIRKPVYVLDRLAQTPIAARLFETAEKVLVVHAAQAPREHVARLREHGAETIEISETPQGLDLNALSDLVGKRGVQDLWVEAGGVLFDSLRRAGLVRKALFYVAPKWLGQEATAAFSGHDEAPFASARQVNWHVHGTDAVCEVEW